MKKFRHSLDRALDIFETNVSTALLATVLSGFLVAIFCRYLFKMSIPVMDELVVIAFTWIALFSSPGASKRDAHVSFTVIYDAMGPRGRAILDAVSKALVLGILLILLRPSWETICFYKIRKTSMLKMPFNYLYLPYMYFLIMTIYYMICGLVEDIGRLAGERKAREGGEKRGV